MCVSVFEFEEESEFRNRFECVCVCVCVCVCMCVCVCVCVCVCITCLCEWGWRVRDEMRGVEFESRCSKKSKQESSKRDGIHELIVESPTKLLDSCGDLIELDRFLSSISFYNVHFILKQWLVFSVV